MNEPQTVGEIVDRLPAVRVPGFVDGLPEAEYHDYPALSAGGAQVLVDTESCPADYFDESPFNPDWRYEKDADFAIGTAAHLAILEPAEFDARAALVEFDSYQTKAAKAAKAEALAAGKVPLKRKEWDAVQRIRDAVLNDSELRRMRFEGGASERSFFCVDRITGVPRKARVDKMPLDGGVLFDVKTTADIGDRALQRTAANLGWHMIADWYCDVVEQVTKRRPEEYWFVVVKAKPPYRVRIVRMDFTATERAAVMNAKALEIFAACARDKHWPAFPSPHVVALPQWAEYQFVEREMSGAFALVKKRPDIARRERVSVDPFAGG